VAFSVTTVPPVTTSEIVRRAVCADTVVSAAPMSNTCAQSFFICAPIVVPPSLARLSSELRRGGLRRLAAPSPHPASAIRSPQRTAQPLYSLCVPVHLVNHPLVHDALVSLRDKRTA